MKTKRSLEGYLLIDHKASPGLPPNFMASLGLSGPAVAGGTMFEAPTMTCSHCGTVVIINPARTRPRNYCQRCDNYVCDNPACNAECVPFSKVLDDAEKDAYRREQSSLILRS